MGDIKTAFSPPPLPPTQEKLIALKEIKEMHPYGADKITSKKYLHQGGFFSP